MTEAEPARREQTTGGRKHNPWLDIAQRPADPLADSTANLQPAILRFLHNHLDLLNFNSRFQGLSGGFSKADEIADKCGEIGAMSLTPAIVPACFGKAHPRGQTDPAFRANYRRFKLAGFAPGLVNPREKA